MTEILDRIYFNNTVLDYLIAAAIIIIGILFIRLFKSTLFRLVKRWAGRTRTDFDDLVLESLERFGIPAVYFVITYIGISSLELPLRGQHILRIAITVVVTYFIIRLVSAVLHVLLRTYVGRQDRGEEKVKQLGGIMLIVNIVIWTIGLLFLFDNMGYDITAIIAGLGIGGIAVALAAQNILGDLFNYFVIFFDRPFEVGDFVVVDQKAGTVEHIGIKTTRVKSLSGEQLVFANTDLTGSRIHNYKRMERRRIVFKFGVVYQTTLDQLKMIPGMVRAIIEAQEPVTFDRAHFLAYGDSSLDFEVVYIVLSSQYNVYMDIQQAINLEIFRQFQEHGIEFAHPTRTLYMMGPEGDGSRTPALAPPAE